MGNNSNQQPARAAPRILTLAEFQSLEPRDKILHILHFAVLAPSTHNTQPWYFEVTKDQICRIFLDSRQRLKQADGDYKYSYVSLGALLKNLRYAAQYYGVMKGIRTNGGDRRKFVAQAVFDFDAAKINKRFAPYMSAMLRRYNYRGNFEKYEISQADLEKLINPGGPERDDIQIFASRERGAIRDIAALTAEGLRRAYSNPEFRREVAAHINFNHSSKARGMHGYTLRLGALQSLVVPRLMKSKDIGKILAEKNRQGLEGASAVVVLASTRNTPEAWLETGQSLEKMLLGATASGLKTSIFVASMEFKDTRNRLHKILGISPRYTAHMLLAVGYSSQSVGFSHRQHPEPLTRFL